MSTEPYTVVNHVVQYKLPEDTTWSDWPSGPNDDLGAKLIFSDLIASRRHRGGRLIFRVIKRIAVITDEVILEEDLPSPRSPDGSNAP